MHAVERLAAPRREQLADDLVRADHQLLDEHVRVRLGLEPGVGHPAVAVEAKRLLGRLHLQGAAREPRRPPLGREPVVQLRGTPRTAGGASRRSACP